MHMPSTWAGTTWSWVGGVDYVMYVICESAGCEIEAVPEERCKCAGLALSCTGSSTVPDTLTATVLNTMSELAQFRNCMHSLWLFQKSVHNLIMCT